MARGYEVDAIKGNSRPRDVLKLKRPVVGSLGSFSHPSSFPSLTISLLTLSSSLRLALWSTLFASPP